MTEIEVESQKETFLLGNRQQLGGKADDYVETIRDVCGDVKNTMTDRWITNDCVDRQLSLDRDSNNQLNSFRCSMHPLGSFYHACEKVVKEFDETANTANNLTTKQMPYKKGSESETQALLRAINKLFHNLGTCCGKEL